MECIDIDYVGPYPDGGYTLVTIDTFTRWIELFPVDASAVCLLQHFGRFGAPAQVRSDRGSHFVNSVIRVTHLISIMVSSPPLRKSPEILNLYQIT
jgi:hypothetical protein